VIQGINGVLDTECGLVTECTSVSTYGSEYEAGSDTGWYLFVEPGSLAEACLESEYGLVTECELDCEWDTKI